MTLANGATANLPSIFQTSPQSWEGLPGVSFFEMQREFSDFADDTYLTCVVTYEVNIYDKLSGDKAEQIFSIVDIALSELDLKLISVENNITANCNIKKCLYKITI